MSKENVCAACGDEFPSSLGLYQHKCAESPVTEAKLWGEGDKLRRLAIETACQKHPKIPEALFKSNGEPEMSGEKEECLKIIGAWSSGEQILARLAIDIWFYPCESTADLMDIARRLDDVNFENALKAIRIARRI